MSINIKVLVFSVLRREKLNIHGYNLINYWFIWKTVVIFEFYEQKYLVKVARYMAQFRKIALYLATSKKDYFFNRLIFWCWFFDADSYVLIASPQFLSYKNNALYWKGCKIQKYEMKILLARIPAFIPYFTASLKAILHQRALCSQLTTSDWSSAHFSQAPPTRWLQATNV